MTPLEQQRQKLIEQASLRQKEALHADHSVWVAASAGTGKTYVLISRILKLLLHDLTLQPGQVLAVTYTKAAAREMENRIYARLSDWARCDEEKLGEDLHDLLGCAPDDKTRRRARQLLAVSLEDGQGFRISTLHSFCQSLLAQFPLEAGIPVQFEVLEGRDQQQLLLEAQNVVFAACAAGENDATEAFAHLAADFSEYTLREAFDDFIYQHRKFRGLFERCGGLESVIFQLSEALGVEEAASREDFLHQHMMPDHADALRDILPAMAAGGVQAKQRGEAMAAFLVAEEERRAALWLSYVGQFFTQKGEPAKKLADAKVEKIVPGATEILLQEQKRLAGVREKLNAMDAFTVSRAYLQLGHEILETYRHIKHQSGKLDFDDLIAATATLLTNEDKSAWVRYRMDMRLAHVLLDEGQDIDEEQWRILHALVEEFFAGEGVHERTRTFFAVGDMKQSIYRFRGAQPHVFGGIRSYLDDHGGQGAAVKTVGLETSFRSSEAVLNFVDAFCADPARRYDVDELAEDIQHHAVRTGEPGWIEMWPVLEEEKQAKDDTPWPLPTRAPKPPELKMQLAQKVAISIKELLESGRVLAVTEKPVTAGDIMILVRKRHMLPYFVTALDQQGIPHSGADEDDLLEDPVVADLVALLKFLANVQDNLSLAQVLRSPLVGLDDDDLMALRLSHKGTLWQALYKSGESNLQQAKEYLTTLLGRVDNISVYALLVVALDLFDGRGCFGKTFYAQKPGAVDDVIDAFLDVAQNFSLRQDVSLTSFLAWLEQGEIQLKKDMAGGDDAVRLLTAHKSKGLEAPVVYLPDTTSDFRRGYQSDKLLWQLDDAGHETLFLYRRSGAYAPDLQKRVMAEEESRLRKDEMRLLYVALTRAKERLYIGGAGKIEPDSWYAHLQKTVEEMGSWKDYGGAKVLTYPAQQPLIYEAEPPVKGENLPDIPTWVDIPAVAEQRTQVLQASALVKEELGPATLDEAGKNVFLRGRLVHRLLEVLPLYPAQQREKTGAGWLEKVAPQMVQYKRDEILTAVMQVFAQYPEFFGEDSRPEAMLVAQSESYGRIEGRVDRLVVTADDVIIIDYKTDFNVPENLPAKYRRQLDVYVKAAEKVFPGKKIRAAVLWTAAVDKKKPAPRLDWLPEQQNLLDLAG